MRRYLWPSRSLVACPSPIRCCSPTPFQQRLGALILLYAIAASAWNMVGGYAGQISVGHAVFFGCRRLLPRCGAYTHFGAAAARRAFRSASSSALLIAAVIGVPTLAAVRPLLQHGDDRGRRAGPADRHQLATASAAAIGLQRPGRAAHCARSLVHVGAALLLPLSRRAGAPAGRPGGSSAAGWASICARSRIASARPARWACRPAATSSTRFMLSAGFTAVAGSLYAMMFGFVDPDFGLGILISVKMLIMAALGGAGTAVRAAGRRPDPGAAGGDLQQPARRQRRRPDLHRLWRASSC